MQQRYFYYSLIAFIIFMAPCVVAKRPYELTSAPNNQFRVPSFTELLQENIHIRVIQNDPWQSIDYTNKEAPGHAKNFEMFKTCWKDIGSGLLGGIKYIGKGAYHTPRALLDKLGDCIEDFVNWMEGDSDYSQTISARENSSQKNTITPEKQAPHQLRANQDLNEYSDLLKEHLVELEDSPHQKVYHHYKQRIEIFDDTQNIHIVEEKIYTIEQPLVSYMQEHALSMEAFRKCSGNHIQQQLHQELLDILTTNDEINRIFVEYEQKATFTDIITEGAELARESNTKGDVLTGFRIADYCHWLNEAEYSLLATILKQAGAVLVGVAEGGIHAVKNTCHMICHPLDSLENLFVNSCKIGRFLLYASAELSLFANHVSFDGAPSDYAYFTFPKKEFDESFKKYELQHPEFIKYVEYYNELKQAFDTLPPEEKTRRITAFAFELYFTGKLLRQIGHVKSAVYKHAIKPTAKILSPKLELFFYKATSRTFNHLSRTCKMVENFIQRKRGPADYYFEWILDENGTWKEAMTIREYALETPFFHITEMAPSTKTAISVQKATEGVCPVLESITNKITAERLQAASFIENTVPQLIEPAAINIHAQYYQTLEDEINYLRSFFKITPRGWGKMSNKYLKIDYDHIFKADPNSKLSGLHHDFLKYYEKNNILEFQEKIFGQFGEYGGRIKWNGLGVKAKIKTFFPSHWSRKKVIENILEAYNNFLTSGIDPILEKRGTFRIVSKTNSGMLIEMYIDQSCNLLSAFPII